MSDTTAHPLHAPIKIVLHCPFVNHGVSGREAISWRFMLNSGKTTYCMETLKVELKTLKKLINNSGAKHKEKS
jgi:hypothetical protein